MEGHAITFSRPLTTANTKNNAQLGSGNFQVMYATAANSQDGNGNSYSTHVPTIQGTGAINFFTGATFATGNSISPGQLLAIIVACLMAGYFFFRFSYKAWKYSRKVCCKEII